MHKEGCVHPQTEKYPDKYELFIQAAIISRPAKELPLLMASSYI